jgi:hypothetical protein
MINILKIMRIVKYTDAYFYACGIAPHKYKRTVYVIMRPYFKTMKVSTLQMLHL